MFKFIRKKLVVPAIAVVGVLLVISFVPAISGLTVRILKFPLASVTILGREIAGIIFYHRHMVENEQLRKHIDFLRQKVNALEDARFENQRLSRLLSLKQRLPYKVIACRVIARSPDNWSSVVVVDKGSLQGVRQGLAVVNFLGLVGRVVETTPETSKVLLINDSNLSISGLIERSRQEGLVSGTLGTFLIMRYLPGDCDIKVSDLVITSGLTDTYPKGILIGMVIEVADEFSGLGRTAVIRPAANLGSLEEVLIIIP